MQCGQLVSYRHRAKRVQARAGIQTGFGGHDEGVEEADCAALLR
jgi:hypothetical protein